MRPIQGSIGSMQMIVRAAVVLHNYLRQTNSAGYALADLSIGIICKIRYLYYYYLIFVFVL